MTDGIIFTRSGGEKIELEYPSEPATASELAKFMVKVRHAHERWTTSELSDAGVERLVNLAFNLSIREDEGRFPKLRVISGTLEDHRLTTKFATPLKFDDVHELRRLAPVAGAPDFALLVSESLDGTLYCPGLANIGHLGSESQPGRPEMLEATPSSFCVWIEGPGHLYVHEEVVTVEFRAGRVRVVVDALKAIPELREMLSRVGETIHKKAMRLIDGVSRAEKYFGGYSGVSRILHIILKRLLVSSLEFRHGGAFVLLPGQDPDPDSFDVTCKYPLKSPDLGEDIACYWATHVQACDSKKEGVNKYDRKLVKCNERKARLLTNLAAVSRMSAADGCVVMTEQLRMLGFGGNIDVSNADCQARQTEFRLNWDDPCNMEEFLRRVGGQRHQSAARLVIKHNDVIAFVVSQDGELTAFSSDADESVRAYRPIDPFMSPDTN